MLQTEPRRGTPIPVTNDEGGQLQQLVQLLVVNYANLIVIFVQSGLLDIANE